MGLERLDKFLGNAGVTSRKHIKKLLKLQDVRINGKRVIDPGVRIEPIKDVVSINGQVLVVKEHVYFLLNKPKDVLSTTFDIQGRMTVVDLVDTIVNIFPVGRLDKDTTGLVLLTNDGELAHKLIHPKFHVPKIYLLTIAGSVSLVQMHAFQKGILLFDGLTLPADVKILHEREGVTILEVTLFEGKNRQIRRMCIELGLDLIALRRVKFGTLDLGDLPEGDFRELSDKEVKGLQTSINLH